MGRAFASEKRALGICDRCGFQYKLKYLKQEYWNRNKRSNRVCEECWDGDHPQLRLGRKDFKDYQALRDPRVNFGDKESRGLFGFDPVGSFQMFSYVGTVTVV